MNLDMPILDLDLRNTNNTQVLIQALKGVSKVTHVQ